MAIKTEVYVDTSALIAFLDRSDSHHPLFHRLFADPPAMVTSTLVIAEGHGWFLRRYDRTRALQFLAMVEDFKLLHPIAVGSAEHAGGVKMLRRFADQNLTLADAVGLYIMKERRISICWSTDRHLGLTGVPLIVNRNLS
ncbi:MAG: PIN domain-containing protein [Acidobacteria bacterium]|nr:PIN domain-containing protein [Acidobacteriota bacterium]